MSLFNPGKGVDYYCFHSTPKFKTTFFHPVNWGKTASVTYDEVHKMIRGNFEIAESDIGVLSHTGRFAWEVHEPNLIARHYADIAPLTGNVGSSDMNDMLNTPSITETFYAVSYGFYDASTGWWGLTNHDQSYVYTTRDQEQWMFHLNTVHQQPLCRFVLPGAHDAGMYDATTLAGICRSPQFIAVLAAAMAASAAMIPLIGGLVDVVLAASALNARRILTNFAFTQKESVSRMLSLGIRYFDFRPGYCISGLRGSFPGLYHQHAFVPGVSYATFLDEVLAWMKMASSEIVVLAVGYAGFVEESMKPTTAVLQQYLHDAQVRTGTTDIQVGDKSHLGQTYQQLVSDNRRLFFLNQAGADYYPASKYDSYTSAAYQTTDVSTILTALNGMTAQGQAQDDYTVLQLQGTVTGTKAGIEGAAVSLSDAGSPLLATKANFDHSTYPWVDSHVNRQNFRDDKLIVLLNDFAENALTEYAVRATARRVS